MSQLDATAVRQTLAGFGSNTLTLYLDINPATSVNQGTRPAWEIWTKNAVKEIDAAVDESQRSDWAQVRARLDDFLDSYSAQGRSLALFVGPDDMASYTLPITMEPRSSFGPPLVTPLLWALEEYARYMIVMIDREKVRLLTASLNQPEPGEKMHFELDDYDFAERPQMPPTSGQPGEMLRQGNMREAYEDMIDAHRQRFFRDAAERVMEVAEARDVHGMVLGGNEEEAHRLRELLHSEFRPLVIDVQSIPRHLADHAILKQVQPAFLKHERAKENEMVDRVLGVAHAGGKATIGATAVKRALDEQRVELLLLPFPVDNATDALAYKALRNNAKVELVGGEAAQKLTEAGGVAADLYYELPTS